MLNEEKIRLMTKAASFEAGEGKEALSADRYFRGDYISLKLIGAWLSFTVAFALCAGLWVFYKMDFLMDNLHKMDLPAMGKGILIFYLSLLGIFLVLHYIVFHDRYLKYQKKLIVYQKLLKRISRIYETEAKSGSNELISEGVREDDNLTGI